MGGILMQGLHELFHQFDSENTGRISTEQFKGIFESPHMRKHLQSMNVNPLEAASLFSVLDDDDSGTIDYCEFVGGCMRLRQAAKAIDIIMVMHEAQEVQKVLSEFIERADSNFSKLDKVGEHHIKRESQMSKLTVENVSSERKKHSKLGIN